MDDVVSVEVADGVGKLLMSSPPANALGTSLIAGLENACQTFDDAGTGCVVISSDVERTIAFYQDLLEFPMTELFQNRDYVGSTHFFFDLGNGNALAFFDFPGLGLEEYQEVLGGHHHLAISMPRDNWERVKGKLEAAGVEMFLAADTSMYFTGPDGERLELISDPLGEMYGNQVL